MKGNLVGVVAPTEWEAIQAAQQVSGDTKWTDWKGLPGSAKLYEYLKNEADWKSTPRDEKWRDQRRRAPRRLHRRRRSFPPPISCRT